MQPTLGAATNTTAVPKMVLLPPACTSVEFLMRSLCEPFLISGESRAYTVIIATPCPMRKKCTGI